MMECIVAKGTPVRDFKEQIVRESRVQGINYDFRADM